MTVSFKLENGDKLGPKFSFGVKRYGTKATKAAQGAARRAAEEIETQGRADIRKGGNFKSRRWIEGFRAKLSFQSKNDMSIRVTHDVKYWKVFEFGAKIFGRPLLWIPLSFAKDAQKVSARDYPGRLFRVDRVGKAPLLMADGGVPKYFGKPSVTIPKKWHLRAIVRGVARNMRKYYREAFTNGR